jgi:hypothetical protein
MKILLSPVRCDDTIEVTKSGNILTINGEVFDFSPIGDGDTLPLGAIKSVWFVGPVDRLNGELVMTLLSPIPRDYSQEQAFPSPLTNVADGLVVFPASAMREGESYIPPALDTSIPLLGGVIDWSKLITKEMKDAEADAEKLSAAKLELSARNRKAGVQIARIQDRIDTIGFGIEIGEATPEEEAEQAALLLNLKAWKTYKYALGKVTVQPTWYQAPVWPVEPPIPEIIAAPMLATAETI